VAIYPALPLKNDILNRWSSREKFIFKNAIFDTLPNSGDKKRTSNFL